MQELLVGRTQIAQFAGTKPDMVAFWTRYGVLVPEAEPAGTTKGRHHRYAISEAHIARVLVEISRFGLRIESLRGIADCLRNALAIGERLGLPSLHDGEQLWHLEKLRRDVVSVVTKFGRDPKEYSEEVAGCYKNAKVDDLVVPPTLDDDDWTWLNIWNVIQRGITGASGKSAVLFWVDNEPGTVCIYPSSAKPEDDGHGSYILVDLHKVFSTR